MCDFREADIRVRFGRALVAILGPRGVSLPQRGAETPPSNLENNKSIKRSIYRKPLGCKGSL